MHRFLHLFLSLSLSLAFISPLICSPPHNHNPSPGEEQRVWGKEGIDEAEEWWRPAGTFAESIRGKDARWRQATGLQLICWWQNLCARWKCACTVYSTLAYIHMFSNMFLLMFVPGHLAITWPGNCLMELWPSASCCPCWRPEPFHWPAPHSQSWPQPREGKRNCGRKRGVDWRNPRTEKLGRSGRRAHRLDRWSLGHIWEVERDKGMSGEERRGKYETLKKQSEEYNDKKKTEIMKFH